MMEVGMKSAEERTDELLGTEDGQLEVIPLLMALDAALREACGREVTARMPGILAAHAEDARADEQSRVVAKLREHRASVAALDSFTMWENHEVLEDLDKMIAELGGSSS